MIERPVIRAAEYLRVSTDNQKYSLENQAIALRTYAAKHDIEIIASYVDAGKSGVSTKGRAGLKALLADVLEGTAPFSLILVLDVSRWGRFQDPDEAAHYEFLCREAGIRVRYCAEAFSEDSMGSVVKQLKRVMAGEYSRDLSARVKAGRRGKAIRGRALGGRPIYGFRRQIMNADGSPGPVLEDGERKGRLDQEVIYVWGPPEERDVLRRIFYLFVHRAVSQAAIARHLNAEAIPWRDGTAWTPGRVQYLLRRELVIGYKAYGKTHVTLGQTWIVSDRTRWTFTRVLEPLVDIDTYASAQLRLQQLGKGQDKTDGELVRDLKRILSKGGRLSSRSIDDDPDSASSSVYRNRFGSMKAAYSHVGYGYSGFRKGRGRDGLPMKREEVVLALRAFRERHGRISARALQQDPTLPSLWQLRQLFGSIPEAYAAAGITDGGRRATVRGRPVPDMALRADEPTGSDTPKA